LAGEVKKLVQNKEIKWADAKRPGSDGKGPRELEGRKSKLEKNLGASSTLFPPTKGAREG